VAGDTDTAIRFRLNPGTYVQLAAPDEVVLKNIHGDSAVGMAWDMLLVLHRLSEWIAVGDLLDDWPEDQHHRLIDHLDALQQRKIVVSDQAAGPVVPAPATRPAAAPPVRLDLEHHFAMLRDFVRGAAYRGAIERATGPQTIALDLGCGSGLLTLFLARAGASRVFALEPRPHVMALARELAETNGLSSRIDFVEAMSTDVPASRVTPRATLLVAEILGNGILNEKVLEFTIDARDRLLAPAATLIPFKIDICAFGFDSGVRDNGREEVNAFGDMYGFDFSPLYTALTARLGRRSERFKATYKPLTSDVVAHTVDLRSVRAPGFRRPFELRASVDGELTGICVYFKAHLDAQTILTNSPWAASTHWVQQLYTLPGPRRVREGDLVTADVVYDGDLRIEIGN
jgi:SAM-dependent methyltransferase